MSKEINSKIELAPGLIRWLLLLLIVIAIVILLRLFLPPFLEQRKQDQQAQQKQVLTEYATMLGRQISQPLLNNAERLKSMSRDPSIIALFESYDAVEADKLALTKQTGFDQALKLRLLPPDIDQPDHHSNPPLTFASLEMIRAAVDSDTLVEAEWHFPKQAEEHIVLVQRVNDDTGKAIGVLHLSQSITPVKSLFETGTDSPGTYVELRQTLRSGGSVLLGQAGDKSRADFSEVIVKPVPGTSWQMSVQNTTSNVIDNDNFGRMAGAAILAILLGGILILARKARKKPYIPPAPAESPERSRKPAAVTVAGIQEKLQNQQLAPAEPSIDGIQVSYSESQPDNDEEINTNHEESDVPEMNNKNNDEMDEASNAPASIFRAYDIRGVVGETLTEQIVGNIGRALGSEAINRGDNTVIVGRDGRLSSPALSQALIRGLTESGRDVIDIGMVPTPVLYFATHFFDTSSGVMITGSHNPPNYNGIKMVLAGTTLADEAIQSLRQRILSNDVTSGSGKSQQTEISQEYIRRITDDIPVALSNSFKVVVDAGNGVAGVLGPQLIRALGHDVIELYCDIDGHFPNHHPDPSQPDNLAELIARVKSEKADLGMAFDGDGDRLGVVDRDGNIIWPDRQMMLFARDVIERNPGGEIIFDVKCSNHLKRVIEDAGGKATMWKTGHSLIKAKMKQSGALLAGEMSGHVFFKERWYGFDDGLYTAARLLEILSKSDQAPHEILGSLPGGVSTPELRLDMPEDQHAPFMATLTELADFGEGEVGTIDGIRVDFKDGWGLIRPSNTTPCLVMRFEADNEAALQRVQDLFRQQLLTLDPMLKLPF